LILATALQESRLGMPRACTASAPAQSVRLSRTCTYLSIRPLAKVGASVCSAKKSKPKDKQCHRCKMTPQQHQCEATTRKHRVSHAGKRSPDSESARRELSKSCLACHCDPQTCDFTSNSGGGTTRGTNVAPGPAKAQPVYHRSIIENPLSLTLLGDFQIIRISRVLFICARSREAGII
jgi:hypothetical protein